MHIADVDAGMLGANGIVGAGPPIATGAALTADQKDEDRVALAFFGDGAVAQDRSTRRSTSRRRGTFRHLREREQPVRGGNTGSEAAQHRESQRNRRGVRYPRIYHRRDGHNGRRGSRQGRLASERWRVTGRHSSKRRRTDTEDISRAISNPTATRRISTCGASGTRLRRSRTA